MQASDITTERPRRRRRRTILIGEIIEFLEYLAPPSMASPEAPYGLQVGTRMEAVKGVVVTPLPTYNAISTAAAHKASLLLCAAPLLTEPLPALRWDDPLGGKIAHLVQRQVSFYALSNAYAAAPGGFDDCLAECLGLAARGVLVPTTAETQLKFVVFVPVASTEAVRRAACEAGAGVIGAYTHCSFRTEGTGTFLPRAGTHPAIGMPGHLETAPEDRLELLVPERELAGVLSAVLEAHPYEKVAYDIYPLRNPGVVYGRGRYGELPLKVSLDTVLAQVNDALELPAEAPARCHQLNGLPVGTLAVASGTGAGESLFWAAHRQEAGALVVGGVALSDLMLADSLSTVLIDVGFAPSVMPGLQRLTTQLRDTFASDGIQVQYIP